MVGVDGVDEVDGVDGVDGRNGLAMWKGLTMWTGENGVEGVGMGRGAAFTDRMTLTPT